MNRCRVSLARHVAWFGLADLRGQRFGLERMRCEDCGVVCALVLLLRLARFPPVAFLSWFHCFVWTLDAYVTGVCCDLRDPVEAFVLETVLDSERGWVDCGRGQTLLLAVLAAARKPVAQAAPLPAAEAW